jgi:hypothetical protein
MIKDKNNNNFQHLNINMVFLIRTLNPNNHRLYTHDKNQGYNFLFDLVLGGSWLLWKTFVSSSKNKIGTILVLNQNKNPIINYSKNIYWIFVLVQILVLNINGTKNLVPKPNLKIRPKLTILISQTWCPPNASCFI